MTLKLPPEIEEKLNRRARQQKTTPELLAVDLLREQLDSEVSTADDEQLGTLADFLGDFIGCIDSSEYVPGGAQMSINSGKQFAEGMVEKRRQGRL